MTNFNQSINARDLSSRLDRLLQNDTLSFHGSIAHDANTMSGNRRVPRTASFDSLPRFSKSSTMSSISTSSTRFSGLYAYPSRALHRKDVVVSPGEFSTPRVPRHNRRGTDVSAQSSSESRKKKDSFQAHAYGRHSNQWLFNDFSITDAVRKGYGKCFGRDN
ncbi:hypothetical protein C7974DRAFT_129276 [Boeremia exigua]|uniref:uncharacterized protein n=1 Tax=Boeremia exigua TaxID=749465 RepID=UPI001E8D836D|nr:uncharacterized protein C7974DRAFT_129276 [Boeremia exigua]KAH6639334.1 hypothetical protein C7974DRAFT_129276 [Boeremia exigua]